MQRFFGLAIRLPFNASPSGRTGGRYRLDPSRATRAFRTRFVSILYLPERLLLSDEVDLGEVDQRVGSPSLSANRVGPRTAP